MSYYVPRTCSDVTNLDTERTNDLDSRPLEAFRSLSAYVLLGDPGMGKTTVFQHEADTIDDGLYITARNFITLDPDSHPEWRNRTLFIDGLDEVRAGSSNYKVPFDKIRGRLDSLKNPRFRLSCRAADWLGSNDLNYLKSVSPDGSVSVLRLDPLQPSDINQMLNEHPDVEDADAILKKAIEFGIEGFLDNPQGLELLVAALEGGRDWPLSRLELFENACQTMAQEQNDEHFLPEDLPDNPDLLLDPAGRLCALVLISGAAGFAVAFRYGDEEFPYLGHCEYKHPEYINAARASKLFRASNGRFVSVHRHVAEYLAARHLGKIINGGTEAVEADGLPARRVIALMAGEDGSVVSELRGVSGWLAALCPKARRELVSRDPVGVGLYGDIRGFSSQEKHEILHGIRYEVSKLDSIYHAASAFAPLATPELESQIRQILEDTSTERKHLKFVDFVLSVLAEGVPMPVFSDLLFEIVRDGSRPHELLTSALFAFLHNCPESEEKTAKLNLLLEEIQAGSVKDYSNELLGTILSRFYPTKLPPSVIWDFLIESGRRVGGNSYYRFWQDELIDRSSNEQIAELLDCLQSRLPGLYQAIEYQKYGDMILRLLLRGLEIHGETVSTDRLYDWLEIGCPDYSVELTQIGNTESDIRSWLEDHPYICRMILLEGLHRGPDTEEFWSHTNEVARRLYDASMPSDHGLWCLNQAVESSETYPWIAEFFWAEAVSAYKHQRSNGGLSIGLLKRHASLNNVFKAKLDILLSPPSDRDLLIEKRKEEANQKTQRRQNRWIAHIRSNEAALRENRASPELLYRLAEVYFGHFMGYRTGDGLKAIAEELGGDEDLVVSAIHGLVGAPDREDLPSPEAILDVHGKKRFFYLGLPLLAGLEELERMVQGGESQLDDQKVRTALAFYFTSIHGNYHPAWYERVLADNPAVVAEVLEEYAVSQFRFHRDGVSEAHDLAYDPTFAEVATIVTLPLLGRFPVRCNRLQLDTLENLLRAAIRNLDTTLLQKEIERKLSLSSMDIAQRARWLAAALVVSPGKYNESVEKFVGPSRGRGRRIHALMHLFFPSAFDRSHVRGLETEELSLLIRLIGCNVGPSTMFGGDSFDGKESEEGGYITSEMHSASAVLRMIEALASDSCHEATDALTELTNEDALSDWKEILESNLDRQRRLRRDASFRHPNIEEITHTLTGAQPANAADLSALIADRLEEIATRIRDGNTDGWKRYWNVDSHGRPTEARPEESCRDAMLEYLQVMLPNGVVVAQPEGHYADDKWADMRITFSDFHVPIEVKKNSHRKLWSAIRNQLIRNYTRDPTTAGYGIYLVFWFGKEYTKAPPVGRPPETSAELLDRLKSSLCVEEARKITVCVIDVSRP